MTRCELGCAETRGKHLFGWLRSATLIHRASSYKGRPDANHAREPAAVHLLCVPLSPQQADQAQSGVSFGGVSEMVDPNWLRCVSFSFWVTTIDADVLEYAGFHSEGATNPSRCKLTN